VTFLGFKYVRPSSIFHDIFLRPPDPPRKKGSFPLRSFCFPSEDRSSLYFLCFPLLFFKSPPVFYLLDGFSLDYAFCVNVPCPPRIFPTILAFCIAPAPARVPFETFTKRLLAFPGASPFLIANPVLAYVRVGPVYSCSFSGPFFSGKALPFSLNTSPFPSIRGFFPSPYCVFSPRLDFLS